MIKICFFSIMLGTLSLSLSIFIMNGFEQATKEKLQHINAPIVMQPLEHYLDYEKIKPVLLREFPSIETFTPSVTHYGIVQTGDVIDLNAVVMVNGIEPATQNKVTQLEKFIFQRVDHTKSLQDLLQGNGILIGKKLSLRETIFLGDNIKLVFAQQKKKKIDFVTQEAVVTGIFCTGIDELDNNVVITSLAFLQKIFPQAGMSQIGIKPYKHVDEQQLISQLKDRFGVDVYAWQELYPSLVSVLKLERYVVFTVLLLLIIIASMNLISLIFMLIIQKRRDIVILSILGMKQQYILNIFIVISLLITALATIAGLTIAFIIATYLCRYPLALPDAYYISYLPISIDGTTIGIIFILSLLISFIATLIPISNLKNLNKAQILRFE